jgi:hypothetical protein
MKNLFVLGFVLLSFIAKAQEADKVSVEKNLYGVHLGLLSSGFQYETRLDRKITLMSEVGLTIGMSTKESNNTEIKDQTTTIFAPYVTLEPRWYYGLDRRSKLGRNTKHNSSNYISLNSSFISAKTPVIKNGDFDIVSAIMIIPKYGIRRSFSKNFYYEFSGGYGYQYNIFSETSGCDCDHSSDYIDIQARIGYNF